MPEPHDAQTLTAGAASHDEVEGAVTLLRWDDRRIRC
jgi:hypothetical protein